MDRTNILTLGWVIYDSGRARADFSFSKLTVLRCNLSQNPIFLSNFRLSGGLKGAAMSKTCFCKKKMLENVLE